MPGKTERHPRTAIPEEYSAVALSEELASHPLKVCVLVRKQADPVGDSLVVLRENPDSRVLLGCLADANGCVLEWVEVWIQNVSGAAAVLSSQACPPTNASLDARWRRTADALTDPVTGSAIAAGWEHVHPPPLLLRRDTLAPMHPTDDESGRRWELCTDDSLLKQHGLPTYSGSAHRYWTSPATDAAEPRFVPVTSKAPTASTTVSIDDAIPQDETVIRVNVECGFIRVCPYHPLSYDDYLGLLAGGTREIVPHGRSVLDVGGRRAELADADAPGLLLSGARGAAAQLLETLHLKAALFLRALQSVSAVVARQQAPFLNLSADSFRVAIGTQQEAVPLFWSAHPQLARPGAAVTVTLPASDKAYHLAPEGSTPSIYGASPSTRRSGVRATFRLRSVLQEGSQGAVIEGTYHPGEDLPVDGSDLVWLRLSLGNRTLDLCGHVEADRALAPGEWRFRSIPHRLGEPDCAVLRQAEGVRFETVLSEVLPLLSTPCDLYAMAVLGVKTFLVNDDTTLPVALDECISLARSVDQQSAAGDDVSCVEALFNSDPRWQASLGPGRLVEAGKIPDDPLACLTPALWWRTLIMLLRMFPGVGRLSTCAGLGDAPAGRLESAFKQAIGDARQLVNDTRSLMVNDLEANREIKTAVAAARAGVATTPS